MKQFIFFFATILTFAFASCEKDNPQPQQTPTEPQPTETSYNDFVIMSDQPMDSVVFTNSTSGTVEHITAVVTQVTCNSTTSEKSTFNLIHSASTGDNITVKVYHSSFTFGGLPFSDFLANASTDICEEFGGNSGNQTSNGNSTTFTFIAE